MNFENGNMALLASLELSETCNDLLWNHIKSNVRKPWKTGKELNDAILNLSSCDSEIEKTFYFAFQLYLLEEEVNWIEVIPQYNVFLNDGRYVVDFLIFERSFPKHKLVIECDGHEFHKRTKKQVEYENKREYDLKMLGYDILHFSGSEIYKNPEQCAKLVFDYLTNKSN